jgi:hypothetical protein
MAERRAGEGMTAKEMNWPRENAKSAKKKTGADVFFVFSAFFRGHHSGLSCR